ncbi:septum formation initiator family protein [Blautia luti]|uniref:FtsB family cell division protein n=1 Tax=Blautia glucerasea TaxID=536633 RepID=UPI001D03246F|nr:septum formation initiator family protein [Blautia glucerasea]MCB5420783.1 septum formation initiator family protein [Blautia luti]
MGKSGKKRRKKRIGYNHLGMFGISLIVLILMLSLMAQSRNLQESLAGYETRAEALSQQIEDEKARTEEIEALKEYMLTDEYTEEAAREKLGLVKENEIIFQEEK